MESNSLGNRFFCFLNSLIETDIVRLTCLYDICLDISAFMEIQQHQDSRD